MTDMRATDWLLVRCDELVSRIGMGNVPDHVILAELEDALKELRRRGDTLVRRDDLRSVVERAHRPTRAPIDVAADTRWMAAIDRLEIALGGRIR